MAKALRKEDAIDAVMVGILADKEVGVGFREVHFFPGPEQPRLRRGADLLCDLVGALLSGIVFLEASFSECQHPDKKQMMQRSRELGLAPRQIKFWHNTNELIIVHSKKRMIGYVAKTLPFEKLTNTPFATTVVMLLFMMTLTLMHRSSESKILREELERVSSIAAKFMGRPLSHLPPLLNQMHISPLELLHSGLSLDCDLLLGSCSSMAP
ncbi:hypothetical protein Bca101_067464 [Brassica carinata]